MTSYFNLFKFRCDQTDVTFLKRDKVSLWNKSRKIDACETTHDKILNKELWI